MREISYPKYIEWTDVGLVNETGEYFDLTDSDILEQAFRTDSQYVYIDRPAFQNVLRENGVYEDMDGFWHGFGTYTKMPEIGVTIGDEKGNHSDSEWINQCILSITNAQVTAKGSIQGSAPLVPLLKSNTVTLTVYPTQ